MTLLQDLHCSGLGRRVSIKSPADQAYTDLLTASPQHETHLENGEKRALEVESCVEEDSGYQTSENENDSENENGRETLGLVCERKRGHIRESVCSGTPILGLAYEGEKGLNRQIASNRTEETLDLTYEGSEERDARQSLGNGTDTWDVQEEVHHGLYKETEGIGMEEDLDLAHERRKQRHIRQTCSNNEEHVLNVPYERRAKELTREMTNNGIANNGIEETLSVTDERREHIHMRHSFLTKETQILDLQRETKERKPTRDSFHDDSENLEFVTATTEHGRPTNFLRNGNAKVDVGYERKKRRHEEHLHSNESETLHLVHKRIKKRRTAEPVSEDDEELVDKDSEGEEEKAERQTKEVLVAPFEATSLHSGLHCCTNGFFRVTSATPSSFESNCGCTTHNLVDWRTRVSWTNSNLFHQVKIREVTVLSPFRTSPIIWSHPYFPMRLCPTPQSPPHPHQSFLLPQKPHTPALPANFASRPPQQTPKVKKEKIDDPNNAEGERGYRCNQVGCGRTFCRNEELTRHLRIHSGQRPFVCQRCGRRFVRRDHLTKHQRTHLPAHVKRSYTCPLAACTHRYTRSDALTRHMWTAHHIRARQPSRATTTLTTTTTTTTTATTTANHHHHQQQQQPHHHAVPKLEA